MTIVNLNEHLLESICTAGDLLDVFKSETRMEQAREVRTLIRELADLVPVAVCSGYHDHAGRLASHDRASLTNGPLISTHIRTS